MSPFGGSTYEPGEDRERLTTLLARVRHAVTHPRGSWWRLDALRSACGGTEASVSARLRDLRKDKFGAHDIERRRVAGGLFEYRCVVPTAHGQQEFAL